MRKQCMSVSFAVLAIVAATAATQTHESITVQVIDVPVYVFSYGKPIRNLTKDDFQLFVNGKQQTIDYFDAIDFSPVAASAPDIKSAPPAADPRERRLFLLLFDLAYNRPAALHRARAAAAQMVDRALPQDFFGVAISTSRGAKFIIPFTRDRDIIRRALLKLSPSSAHDSLAISITDAERQSADAWVPDMTGAGGGRGAASEDSMPEIMAGFAAEEGQRAKNLVDENLTDFSAIARGLRDLEGYKHVILFSVGFSADLLLGDPHMINALRSMAQSFHAAGVLLHTFDLGPVGNDIISLDRSAPTYTNGNAASATTSVRRYDESHDDTLFMLAAQTGGQFIHWTNDYTGALEDLSATVGAGYRLGFKPVNSKKSANEIDVKVKNVPRGTTVSFRKGFSSLPESRDTNQALLLADIIQNDIPQSGTPAAFSFTTRPFIDILVPARQLAREHGAITDATLILYIFDGKGTAVDYREKKISIPAAPEKDMAIRQKLALPPGKYVAKSLLRVDKSIGFAKVAFAIPDEK